MSEVFFTSVKAKKIEAEQTLPSKFDRLLQKCGLDSIVKGKRVLIKMHFGGNIGYTTIHPVFVRTLSKMLKKAGVINGYYCQRFISQKPSKLTKIGCFVGLMNSGDEKKWNTFLKKIMNDKTCWKSHMAFVFGDFDLSFNLWADTPNQIRDFIENIIEGDDSVLKIETAMIFDHYKGNFTKSFVR